MSNPQVQAPPDANATVGTIIDGSQKRDAIHVAVEPVIAACTLRPGEHVGLADGDLAGISGKPVGIVDPFLGRPVEKGERFWLFVYPRQITSLRHVWTHPAIAAAERPAAVPEVAAEKSRQWLEWYAGSIGRNYDDLMLNTRRYLESGELWRGGEDFEGIDLPDEFWNHYQNASGTIVDDENRQYFFRCSC